MHDFEFRSYLGLSCRDEFLYRDSLFQLPQVDEFSLFTDFALDPHASSCQNWLNWSEALLLSTLKIRSKVSWNCLL